MLIPHSKLLWRVCAVLILVGTLFLVWNIPDYYRTARLRTAVSACRTVGNSTEQINCIFRVISAELRQSGLPTALEAFSYAYETYPDFANGGCHTRAHRLGDLLYYQVYLGNESIESIEFPQSATACGYGLFHGFLEHLIQNHPQPEFVTQTCEYLTNRLEATMRDIQSICYHGAGHGLALAHTERVTKAQWGSVDAFVTRPAADCAALKKARPEDTEQCYEGIFNILNEYMVAKQYGFTYNSISPFSVCNTQAPELQQACIYEMAQKIDSASGMSPEKMIELVTPIKETRLRVMAFGTGITGIVQQVVANGNGYASALAGCKDISEPYLSACTKSIVGGLFEEGSPQQEYKKALAFCYDPFIVSHSLEKPCYERLTQQLPRFYSKDVIQTICPEIPQAFRKKCTSLL